MDASYYLFIPLLILASVGQAAFLPWVRLGGVVPDVVLVLVMAWSLLRGVRHGLIWALIAGLILDALSAAPQGTFTFALAVASLTCSVGAVNFFRSGVLLPMAGALLGLFAYYVVFLLIIYLAGRPVVVGDVLTRVFLPALIVNPVLMVPVFPHLRYLHRVIDYREISW